MVSSNYVTYYTEHLQAGFHYVEISSDLSNMVEKTKLVTSTDENDLYYMQSLIHNSAVCENGIQTRCSGVEQRVEIPNRGALRYFAPCPTGHCGSMKS